MISQKDETAKIKAELNGLVSKFIEKYLDEEYGEIVINVIARLSRKHPAPFLKGRPEIWAAAIIKSVGCVNFLFDKSTNPYVSMETICEYFGVVKSSVSLKSARIDEMLGINYFSNEFLTPERKASNPANDVDFIKNLFTPKSITKKNAAIKTLHAKGTQENKAFEFIQKAWKEKKYEDKVKLAKQALAADPDCSDAYNILAVCDARTPEESLDLLKKAFDISGRLIGSFENIMENLDEVSGLPQFKAYLRTLYYFADLMCNLDNWNMATVTFVNLLFLNPADDYSVRHKTLNIALMENFEEALQILFEMYPHEKSACFLYGRALYVFKKHGRSPAAKKSIKAAITANKFVPACFYGKPKIGPEFKKIMYPGSYEEAKSYRDAAYDIWKKTPGAIKWMSENM